MLVQEIPLLRGNPTDMRGSCDMANIKRGNGIHRRKAFFLEGFLLELRIKCQPQISRVHRHLCLTAQTDTESSFASDLKGYTLEVEVGGALAQRHFRSRKVLKFPSV